MIALPDLKRFHVCEGIAIIVTWVFLLNRTKLIFLHFQLSSKDLFQTRFGESVTSK